MSTADADVRAPFPVPVADADTQPFWDACARRELVIQRCGACGRWLWQPRPLCSACRTLDPPWHRVSGNGTIASWMVMRPPTLPAYADMVPFVVMLVELEQGVRLLGYLVDGDGAVIRTDGAAEGVRTGRAVRLVFHDQDGLQLPCWTLADDA